MRKGFEFLPDERTPRWRKGARRHAPWRNCRGETPSSLVPADELISQHEQLAHERNLLDRLPKILELLPERERFVVERYFGLSGTEASFSAIGLEMGVSRQRAGQLWQSAQERLLGTLKQQCLYRVRGLTKDDRAQERLLGTLKQQGDIEND